MLIVCPACLSAYRLPAAAQAKPLAAARCAQCGKVFQAAEALSAPAMIPSGSPIASLPRQVPLLPAQRPARFLPDPAPRTSVAGKRTGLLVAAAAVAVFACCAWSGRTRLAQVFPASAPIFAALGFAPSGLSLGEVSTTLSDEGPVKVLTMQTSITNTRATEARLPNMRLVVRDGAEQSLYSWTAPAPRAKLGPGEAIAFSSRLVSPPPNGHDLVVSFADGSDGLAAIEHETGP